MMDQLVSVRRLEEAIQNMERDIAPVREQFETISAKLAKMNGRKAKLEAALETIREFSAEVPATTPTQQERTISPEQGVTPDVNLPQRQPYGLWTAAVRTCIEILRTTGKPWHTRDLYEELRRRGLTFTVNDPVINLSNKLGRSDALRSDTKLGWHLVEWPQPAVKEVTAEQRLELLRKVYASGNTKPDHADSKPQASNVVALIPFYGQGLPEAATAYLSKAGTPMGNVAIAEALSKAGYPFRQKDREAAVETALRRRSDSEGDVVRVAAGTWGMRKWFTKEEREELARSIGGVPGRDAQAHRERTREAVQAGKARGIRFGTRPMLDDEGMARVRQLIASGTPPKEVATSLGVTVVTVHRWIKKWTESDPSGEVDQTLPFDRPA